MPVTNSPIILVVSEDEQNRLNMMKHMDDFGYNVISARPDDDISSALGSTVPDIITADWISPGMEGAVTISTIRNIKALQRIPMIVITGDDTSPVKQEILHGLALPLLKMPWQPEELLNCLEHAVLARS